MIELIKNIVFILFCCITSVVFSQDVLEHKTGLDQFEKISFSKEVIAKNNVRSISTEHMYKKELNPITKNPKITSYYEFNDSGQLLMYYKTFLLYDTIYDTLVEFYTYNENGQVCELRRSEYGKFGVYTYMFKEGRVVGLAQSEEENLTKSKMHFIPKNHIEKYKERYVYDDLDSLSYMKYTLSEDNVRYKEEEVRYEFGKLKKEKTRYLFSKQKYNIYNYYYFEDDLVKKEEVDNYSSKKNNSFIYKYDELKRITQMETYKEEKKTFLAEFLYKENTGLLDAIINKSMKTNAIEIIKYKHTFYK